MTSRILRIGLLGLLMFTLPRMALATTFGWDTVWHGSTRTACIRLYITGICIFLECSPYQCEVFYSPRIRHHLPDLVVSTYNDPGIAPFELTASQASSAVGDLQAVSQQSFLGAETGGASEPTTPDGNPQHLRFKEAQTVGNPGIIAYKAGSAVMGAIATAFPYAYLCPSRAIPYLDYHQSETDAFAWRTAEPDAFLRDGRIIGAYGSHTWATIQPRSGFVIQTDDVKTGAVAAYRSIDLVTRVGQPHRYVPLWGVPASTERDGNWLLIHPEARDACESLGATNHQLAGVSDPDGDQAWIYWPQYTCCIPRPGEHIATIPISPVKVPLPEL